MPRTPIIYITNSLWNISARFSEGVIHPHKTPPAPPSTYH